MTDSDTPAFIGPIDDWQTADSANIPEGRLTKQTLIDPEGQLWFWKRPKSGRETMVWSEYLASYIGRKVLSLEMQEAHVAMLDDELVMLNRFMYDPKSEFLGHGADFLRLLDTDYDLRRQYHHTWKLTSEWLSISAKLKESDLLRGLRFPDMKEHLAWWADTFALDTLICEGDRHGHNWAYIIESGANSTVIRYAPRFDHNNCLAFGWDEVELSRAIDQAGSIKEAAARYVQGGHHHMRWDQPSKKKLPRQEFNEHFLAQYPEMKPAFDQAAKADLSDVQSVLETLERMSDIPAVTQMSHNRCLFLSHILTNAQESLTRL